MASPRTGKVKTSAEFEWTLSQFSKKKLLSVENFCKSPDFKFKDYVFNLKLLGADSKECYSVVLNQLSVDNLSVICTLSIKLNDNTLYGRREISNIRMSSVFENFISISTIKDRTAEFLPEDALTLVLSIEEKNRRGKAQKRKLCVEESQFSSKAHPFSDFIYIVCLLL